MKPVRRPRMIFDCDPSLMFNAMRAAQFLRDRPDCKDAVVSYGEGIAEQNFYVKRNKNSITVRELEA